MKEETQIKGDGSGVGEAWQGQGCGKAGAQYFHPEDPWALKQV